MKTYRPTPDARRSSGRILDTAEGVLIAVRRCSLDQAFSEIMHTAKRHRVDPVVLADVLVALAQGQPTDNLDPLAVSTARDTWEPLLNGRVHTTRPQ